MKKIFKSHIPNNGLALRIYKPLPNTKEKETSYEKVGKLYCQCNFLS